MLSIADVRSQIDLEFGSRLQLQGFHAAGKQRWVRSTKLPLREVVVISAAKGGTYHPVWGVSTGLVPLFSPRGFRRQTTDKNIGLDLTIDPWDEPYDPHAPDIQFISGFTSSVPVGEIRRSAEHFLPRALVHFEKVDGLAGFVRLFSDRSRIRYDRFGFFQYIQHGLVDCFVPLWQGEQGEGLRKLADFCQKCAANADDPVLADCVRHSLAMRINEKPNQSSVPTSPSARGSSSTFGKI